MNPSLLNSRAGETTEFAKPVMGTTVPAPPFLPSLSYHPIPVNRALREIKATEVIGAASFSGTLKPDTNIFFIISPNRQIAPPKINAHTQFFSMLFFGVCSLTTCL